MCINRIDIRTYIDSIAIFFWHNFVIAIYCLAIIKNV